MVSFINTNGRQKEGERGEAETIVIIFRTIIVGENDRRAGTTIGRKKRKKKKSKVITNE